MRLLWSGLGRRVWRLRMPLFVCVELDYGLLLLGVGVLGLDVEGEDIRTDAGATVETINGR